MTFKGFSSFWAALGLLLCSLIASGGWLRAAEIRDLRVVAAEASTQLVVELSGPTEHKLFTLSNPARVVLDLSASSLPARIAMPGAAGWY